MTEKEKAKAYDEAIERTKKLYSNGIAEEIFPELKESEDEKIRKEIISILRNAYWTSNRNRFNELVAWLEKQGEKEEPQVYETKDGKIITYSETDGYKVVEPKFHEGDWVVNKFGDSWHIDNLDKKNYQVSDGKGNYNYFPISKQDEMHVWTIQDAKDGDMLSFYTEYRGNKMLQVGIIKKYVGKRGGCSNTFKIYIGVNWDNILQMGNYMGCSNIHPATKEQRDFLMKEINDAGYEWDTEKKELRRIYQSKQTEFDD